MSKVLLRLLPMLVLPIAVAAMAPATAADGPRLLLAGGALPVCSNDNPAACLPGKSPGPASLGQRHRLDPDGIARVAAGAWSQGRERERRRIVAALKRWHRRAGDLDFDVGDLS
ncbi:MAG: hypothetical protein KDI60_08345, partial [Xanthomonadales bacterium]|nr:hypothetical protein [Xanthomonadales bacterium]